MSEPDLLAQLLVADALSAELKAYACRRVASKGNSERAGTALD
jgi:hypothetical protein